MPNGYERVFISVRGAAADTVVDVEAVKFVAGTGITWGEVESLLDESLAIDPCAENNGIAEMRLDSAARTTRSSRLCGRRWCAANNGGCGNAATFTA